MLSVDRPEGAEENTRHSDCSLKRAPLTALGVVRAAGALGTLGVVGVVGAAAVPGRLDNRLILKHKSDANGTNK
jgi:hypothetical protein